MLMEQTQEKWIWRMVNQELQAFNNKAKAKLIELYSRYIEDPSDEFIQNAAVDIDNEFCSATDAIFDEGILKATSKTASMAFGELSVEEAKEILKSLKELN